jgi:2-haloalkanoic acid dehalogenase type II
MDEFNRFQVLSFDCYGTLIDWEAGIRAELRNWADRHNVAATDDELLTHFAGFESAIQRETTPAPLYPQILEETLRRIGEAVDCPVDETAAEKFGRSVGNWPAFADSAEALRRLQQRFLLVIVSNVDRESFAGSNQRLGVTFDRVITAEEVGDYKPHPAHFDALLAQLKTWDTAPDHLLHVAQSLYHDHEPAQRAGLATVWIDRRSRQEGYGATPPPADLSVTPDWRFPSMAAFADTVLKELA